MPQIGPAEIIVILLVGMLVFGPSRLPEVGRQVGRAVREVKKFQDVVKSELDAVTDLHTQEVARAVENPSAAAAAPMSLLPAIEAVAAPSWFRAPSSASRSQD